MICKNPQRQQGIPIHKLPDPFEKLGLDVGKVSRSRKGRKMIKKEFETRKILFRHFLKFFPE